MISFSSNLRELTLSYDLEIEAGKKAAGLFLEGLRAVESCLEAEASAALTASEIHGRLEGALSDFDAESVYHAARHLAAAQPDRFTLVKGKSPSEDEFRFLGSSD